MMPSETQTNTPSSSQLQDRESTINLLVGARYGVSQVVNRKLSIMTALTDFNSITRIELLPESDRVSLVKIYVQDIKARAASNRHMSNEKVAFALNVISFLPFIAHHAAP